MKRHATKIVLFLVLGAIINVAVAWGSGWHSEPDLDRIVYGASTRSRSPLSGTPVYMWRARGNGIEKVHVFKGEGESSYPLSMYEPLEDVWPAWLSLTDLRLVHLPDGTSEGDAFAQGWPVLAFWCESPDYNTVIGGVLLSRRILPGSYLGVEHVLAFRPIWPGFAINTIFYAAVLWLSVAGLGALRRRRRIKRGLCPACAYDSRGNLSGVCPECSGTVKP